MPQISTNCETNSYTRRHEIEMSKTIVNMVNHYRYHSAISGHFCAGRICANDICQARIVYLCHTISLLMAEHTSWTMLGDNHFLLGLQIAVGIVYRIKIMQLSCHMSHLHNAIRKCVSCATLVYCSQEVSVKCYSKSSICRCIGYFLQIFLCHVHKLIKSAWPNGIVIVFSIE